MPGARRSVLHACSDGRGVRARVRSPAGHRDAAAGKTNAQRPGLTAMHVVVASHYRLPVKGYGGTERVVVALVRGLAALGHRVTLLASPGTRVPEATGVEVPPDRIRDPALDLATLLPPGADILHAIFPVRRGPSQPLLPTLEGDPTPGSPPLSNKICVSRDHAPRPRPNLVPSNRRHPAALLFPAPAGGEH